MLRRLASPRSRLVALDPLLASPARQRLWPPRRRLLSTASVSSPRSPPTPPHQQHDDRSAYSLGAAMLAVAIGTLGLAYASVPLYRMFCQATGFGGTPKRHGGGGEEDGYDLPKDPSKLPNNRPLRITFNTDVSGHLPWSFKPVQKHVTVLAGQTSLAFFEATNHSKEPIIGVATYNVVPNEAGAYFNKIQCFCFDEQRLLPGETVDMPVFFYIDPEFLTDRRMGKLDTMTLSYTFFRSNEIYDSPVTVTISESPAPAAVAA
jgi:cytochrome c oxidase assembly protein subunit 11